MATRYDQLIALTAKIAPRTIIEIGVHKGARAVAMAAEALKSGPVHYIGYDVFETLGEEFQEEALNGKGMVTEAFARRKLGEFAAKNPGFTFELRIGDTRDTLHGKSVTADLVFIDGDHRVEAIRGDYLAVADSAVVVFDDYYRPDATGRTPDLEKYGANAIADDLNAEVLPHGDQCKHGGLSHLVVVSR